MSTPDFENMTDDEFAKLESPSGLEAEQATVETTDTTETGEETPTLSEGTTGLFDDDFDPDDTIEAALDAPVKETTSDPEAATKADSEAAKVEKGTTNAEGGDTEDPAGTSTDGSDSVATDDVDTSATDHTKAKQTTDEDPKTPETPAEPGSSEETSVSDEDAYKRIMAPFKANGKEFTPKDPEEVIRLMQMGAGYNRKMQELKPNLRMMKMLEKKGLLDEEKLNFLIDVNDRNPSAIQKLLHEAKIDPLDIDTSEEPKYQPNNHSVSDEEYTFTQALDDIKRVDGGGETVTLINQQWDSASKEEVFKEPSILSLIHEQRQSGIYDKIVDELDRQKTLGAFEREPFIYAYKAVGDYLHSKGMLLDAPSKETPTGTAPGTRKPREMVETRTATQKAKLANSEQVSAAAPSRSNSGPASKPFDPTEMSDEEIMQMTKPPSS